MILIYIIVNQMNGCSYIGTTEKQLYEEWQEVIDNACNINSTLHNNICYGGAENYRIRQLEEIYQLNLVQTRLDYWIDKYKPVYNLDIVKHEVGKPVHNKHNKDWNKKNRGGSSAQVVLKAKNKVTGKWITVTGWHKAADKVKGDWRNIMRAANKNGGYAYGYYWYVKSRPDTLCKRCYGIDDKGNRTKVFDSLTEACKGIAVNDKTKGICTSIKYGQKFRGYYWFYYDAPE